MRVDKFLISFWILVNFGDINRFKTKIYQYCLKGIALVYKYLHFQATIRTPMLI